MRFCVRYNPRRYAYYVLDNEDGCMVSVFLDYDKACLLATWLNREDNKDGSAS